MKEGYDEQDFKRRKKRRFKGCIIKFASGFYNHRKIMHGDGEKKQRPQ